MNSDDLVSIYNEISAMLRQLQLGWIVDQVNQQVAEGKLVVRENVPTYRAGKENSSQPFSDQLYIPSSKAEFIAQEEYTPLDQVNLIINAVQVILDTAMMERELVTFFSGQQESQTATVISIVSDGDETVRIALSPDTSEEQLRTLDELQMILSRLRREIDNANN